MQPAGLGRIAPRRVGRRRGWAASENREEGRILEAQDKQIVPLHVRGGGRWRGWGAGAVASPLPLPLAGSLSRSAGRSAGRKPAAAPAPPPAPRTPRPGLCAIPKRHTEGAASARPCAADRGAFCKGNGRPRAASPRSWIPTARPTPHTRAALSQAARWGRGLQTPFPSFRPPPPPQQGKQKNRREEIRERILPSGLGGGNCPFLPEKLSHWLLSYLEPTHPAI